MISAAANIGYTPSMYGYGLPQGNAGGTSVIASDGTLSTTGLAQAATDNLRNQAQNISQLQQQGASTTNGQGAGQGGGGQTTAGQSNAGTSNAGTSNGQGSGTMLAMQAAVGEYTTSLQEATSMMSSLNDTNRAVAQNTK